MLSSSPSREPDGDAFVNPPYLARSAPGHLLVLYGRLIGPLLGGYLLLDKAFAYIHLPGTPAYVGELVLTVGGLGVLSATGYLRIPVREEPVLALLAAFFLWGFIQFLPGLRTYGINAVREFALCYYCLFAFFTVAALARSPDLLERWLAQLARFVPWLLLWLPFCLVLESRTNGPMIPFTGVSLLTYKSGDAATAALFALGSMWLFPQTRSARSRALLSIVALVVMALSTTQNRGGLLGATAGAVVGLAFLPSRDRLRLLVRAVAVTALGLGLTVQLSLAIPGATSHSRAFSASQLIANVASIGSGQSGSGSLGGTVAARDLLWSLIYRDQVAEGKLVYGFGFGLNLPYLVNDTQLASGVDPLPDPHNSHYDVLARMGLIGLSLWIALWLGWYWRLVTGCRRLALRGMHARRQVGVLCMMVATATLVSSFFDPQLEGAQAAALLWVAFGVGVAVTSFRGWFRPSTAASATDESAALLR